MDKQVFDIQPLKGIDKSLSNGILRKYSVGAYNAYRAANYDPTRERLNFEVKGEGQICEVNKAYSISRRMEDCLSRRGIIDPNEKYRQLSPSCKPRRRSLANIIIGGTKETMRWLAFGGQNVNFNVIENPDNSKVVRQRGIEDWAKDVYRFVCNEFGQDNVISFIVHLDETNPHVHCSVLPVVDNKISWNKFFHSDNKYNGIAYFRQIHDKFAQISNKYGMERGEDIRNTGAVHKSYTAYLKEENVKLKEKILYLEKIIKENGINLQ